MQQLSSTRRTDNWTPQPAARLQDSCKGFVDCRPPSLLVIVHQECTKNSTSPSFLEADRGAGSPPRSITSGLPVTRPKSAAALQNCRFRNGAAGSDASQNEGSLPGE